MLLAANCFKYSVTDHVLIVKSILLSRNEIGVVVYHHLSYYIAIFAISYDDLYQIPSQREL